MEQGQKGERRRLRGQRKNEGAKRIWERLEKAGDGAKRREK